MTEKKALYNSLRINWILDPSMEVEDWQVENYRELSEPLLFSRLRQNEFDLNRQTFLSFAESAETPEEFTDLLFDEQEPSAKEYDKVYLLVFELWRRLLKERPALSIFCDELDYQIFLYDHGKLETLEELQDLLSQLQLILEEQADEGIPVLETFAHINESTAHDIETFLYDFIAEQVDAGSIGYALDLIEAFLVAVEDPKWLELLKYRIISESDKSAGKELLDNLVKFSLKDKDIDFTLELFGELIQDGTEEDVKKLVKHAVELCKTEEDFAELLTLSSDYFHFMDAEEKEKAMRLQLQDRDHSLDQKLHKDDPRISKLLKLFKGSIRP